MKLDRHSSVPLYAQLRELIVERIQEGVYRQGERIPSEITLCQELDLSRPTVRQAIADLVSDGILEIQKGRGTFVSVEPERLLIPHFNALTFSFLNLSSYDDINLQPVQHLDPDPELDAVFNIPEVKHAGYWMLEWPIMFDQQIYGWCSSYISAQVFPDLGQSIASGKRMIDIKGNKYAFLPVKGSVSLLARPAKNKEAAILEIPRRTVVLAASGQLYGRNGSVCEHIRIALRPDLLKLEIN